MVKYQGIVSGFAFRVRITGYRARPNDHVPPGTVGLLAPTELSVDGDVIHATFHPAGSPGLCGVQWPIFKCLSQVPGDNK